MTALRPRPQVNRDVLKALREHHGWSYKRAAAESGVHETEYGFIEKGQRDPKAVTLAAVAQAFGVPLDVLLEPSQVGPGYQQQAGAVTQRLIQYLLRHGHGLTETERAGLWWEVFLGLSAGRPGREGGTDAPE